jgi:hypothetical protein
MWVAFARHNRRRFEPATTAIVTRRMNRTHDPYRVGLRRGMFTRVGIGASRSTVRWRAGGASQSACTRSASGIRLADIQSRS